MSEDITIRPAGPDDAERIAANNIAMAIESEGKALPSEIVAAGVRAALADPAKGRYYLAEAAGRTVGQLLVTLEWSDWRNGWFWWIQSVYVVPHFRRRGVYRRLHDHVRDEGRQDRTVCGLRLYVERDNATAISTYRAIGMRDSGYALLEEDWSGG